MKTNPKRRAAFMILVALAWASAMIVSAILLKGNPAKQWVQLALYAGASFCMLFQTQCLPRTRC